MTKEITVPASPDELPMNRFQAFYAMEDKDRFDFVKLFACLTGCSEDEARAVRASDVQRAMRALIDSIHSTDRPLIEKYSHKGVTYGFEPRLDEITFALMADVCTMFETPETWHKALAILYRPVVREHKSFGGMYAIEMHKPLSVAYQRRQEVFSEAPSSLFISMRAFFLRGSIALESFIRASFSPPSESPAKSK